MVTNNELIIDISDTPIHDYGAKCVAVVIPLCESVTEVHLSNCMISDEGAQTLFEELKTSASVKIIDLAKNRLTSKCFDSLH